MLGIFSRKKKEVEQKVPKKSFWRRPEGVGTFITFALGAIGIASLVIFFPTIISFIAGLLFNLTALIIGGGLLAIIGLFMSSKRNRTAIKYILKDRMKKVGSIMVETNPLAMLKGYVKDLEGKLKEMQNGIEKLNRQIAGLNVKIQERTDEMNKLYSRARAAKNNDMIQRASIDAARARDIEKLLEKYQELSRRMSFLKDVLIKMEEKSILMIERISSKVELKEEAYKMTSVSYGVMESAQAIIRGGTNEKMLFDQAWQYVAEQTEYKVLKMESMLHGMQDFMDNTDLENAANMEEGMKHLENWEQEMEEILSEDLQFLDAVDDVKSFSEQVTGKTSDKAEKIKEPVSNKKAQNTKAYFS